jgi:hypothetical protein
MHNLPCYRPTPLSEGRLARRKRQPFCSRTRSRSTLDQRLHYATQTEVMCCPTSSCTGLLSPRTLRIRRSPRQRGPIGEVRAAAVYFAPSRCEMPFEIIPPAFRQAAPRPSQSAGFRVTHPQQPVQTARRRVRVTAADRGGRQERRSEKVALYFLSSYCSGVPSSTTVY